MTTRVEQAYSSRVVQHRMDYAQWMIMKALPEKNHIIYFDECPLQVSSRRRYGRSKKGCKAVKKVPRQSRTITVMAAICEGSKSY